MKRLLAFFLFLSVASTVFAQGTFLATPRPTFGYPASYTGNFHSLMTFGSYYLIDRALYDSLSAASFAPITGGTNYIQNQGSAAQSSSNFWISGTGVANSSFLTNGNFTLLKNNQVISQLKVQGGSYVNLLYLDPVNTEYLYGGKVSIDSTGYVITPGNLQGAKIIATTSIQTKLLIAGATSATVAAGAGAGTSPTALSANGGSIGGYVTVTTGSSPTASAVIVTVTMPNSYTNASYVTLTPANAAAAALTGNQAVYTPLGAFGATFTINSGSTALAASTTYQWNYHVNGW